MRILILNNQSIVTGGADRHCFDLAAELRLRGHMVTFLATDNAGRSESGAFVPLYVSNSTRDKLPLLNRLKVATRALWNRSSRAATCQLFNEFQPDVIHCHKIYPHISLAPIVEAKKRGIPVVQTVHDYEFISAHPSDSTGSKIDRHEDRLSYRALNTALFQLKHRVHIPVVSEWIAVSRAVAETYMEHGISATAIPNFTLFDSTLGGNVDGRSGVFFAGRLSTEKGIDHVLDLARSLPEVQVSIAGAGPMEPEVQREASRCPSLTYLGSLSQDELQRRMREALICIMPSTWEEPGPLACLEAMACATPIVCFDVGGLGEYVKDAEAGVAVARNESLVDACVQILEDRGLWSRYSRNAQRAIETTHSPARYIDQILKVYRQATSIPQDRGL